MFFPSDYPCSVYKIINESNWNCLLFTVCYIILHILKDGFGHLIKIGSFLRHFDSE